MTEAQKITTRQILKLTLGWHLLSDVFLLVEFSGLW